MPKVNYSEIFHSMQGEGKYTGVPSVWLRFFACNLNCDGFGQCDPTDPTTYELPYKDFDASLIKTVEELPVFNKGCDSSYSWSKKYRHLAKSGTPKEVADKIVDLLKSEFNPNGDFYHEHSRQHTHMCFTGGEPMLHQKQIRAILQEMYDTGNYPGYLTIETNGTKRFDNVQEWLIVRRRHEILMSVSPKLFHVSGERNALNGEAIANLYTYSHEMQLKFVLNTDPRAWDEMERFVGQLRNVHGVYAPVWIMPVGATVEGQDEVSEQIADMALARGYNFSARLHNYVYGNAIGK